MTVEDWDKTMDLNLRSPLFLTQALLDLLKKNATQADPARVIFISSVTASEVFKHVMAYSTSKKGLEHLTPQLALTLCDDHILVNSISPGRFYSEMTRGAWQDPEAESFKQRTSENPGPPLRGTGRHGRGGGDVVQPRRILLHRRGAQPGRRTPLATLTPGWPAPTNPGSWRMSRSLPKAFLFHKTPVDGAQAGRRCPQLK